jgi:cytosolic carboxypeptidase protein 5
MNCKDAGSGLSREGSGRVGIWKATNLVNCYTLECHYQTGRRINVLTPKYNTTTGDIEPEDLATDRNSRLYKDMRLPNFTVEIFEDVGRAVCIALLEWMDINPISRMPTSHYKNCESVRKELIV